MLASAAHNPLVSVVIPCYNAERWISHAILSCLEQSYRPIEIIVIDDGSTDRSRDILASYSRVITWETGPNRGGNVARNRGLALAQGTYIQFLDADDYLLPHKTALHVAALEQSGAGVVWSDFQHRYEYPDGTHILTAPLNRAPPTTDMLAALLSPWWVVPVAILWRREAVVQAGGWDVQLAMVQDKAILIDAALAGVTFHYQPGCVGVYRKYGKVTVSTQNQHRHTRTYYRILQQAAHRLAHAGRLTATYQQALAASYLHLARKVYDLDRPLFTLLMAEAHAAAPHLRGVQVNYISARHRLAHQIFGAVATDVIVSHRRTLTRQLRAWRNPPPRQLHSHEEAHVT
ncbi:MAG: glycosyltransferase [Chloroflexaceae bacterium]|nr:glycosyltransferase [Chloroflexaceae bacterium]